MDHDADRRHMRSLLVTAVAAVLLLPATASAHHGDDMDCGDFSSRQSAQAHMDAHPGDPDRLDGNDGDGRACESLPSGGGGSAGTTGTVVLPPPPPTARTYRAVRVLKVIDGDTLEVRLASGRRWNVRVIGIDTPETRKPGTPIECGGKQATAYMKTLAMRRRRGRLVGRTATLRTDPTQDTIDAFGRLLAYVTVGGQDAGRRMVRAGWAMSYVYDNTPFQRVAPYTASQTAARSQGRGAWSRCGGDFHSAS
jgi:endonuclease YncB( thermonuclease family)